MLIHLRGRGLRVRLTALLVGVVLVGCAGQSAAPTAGAGTERAGEVGAELDEQLWIVLQARDNAYWFGSDGRGVYRYDGRELVRFTTAHGLGGDHVRSIQEDRAGNIYVATEPGSVSRFDGRGFTRLRSVDSGQSGWRLGPDDLWFPGGQDTGVVYRYDGVTLHRLAFPATRAGDEHLANFPRSKFPNAKYSPYDVYTIMKDSKGHVWFGTCVLGACRYDGSMFTWVGHGENANFGVRSIVEDRDGSFWLSNNTSRFVEDAAGFQRRPGIGRERDAFSVFMSAITDKNGDVWLATLHAGVWRYDGRRMIHYAVEHDGAPIRVYSIYRDRRDVLWLGTQEHGAYRFNGTAFERFRV